MNRRISAMTLVEVLVALAIVGMLMAGVSGVLEVVMRNKWIDDNELTFEDSIERALELMANDLRGAVSFAEPKSKFGDNGQNDVNDIFLTGIVTADYLEQLDSGGFWQGLASVYYHIKQDRNDENYKLIRTEVLASRKGKSEHERQECILDNLSTCQLAVSKDNDWQFLSQWQENNPGKLPPALKIVIETIEPQTTRVRSFERLVIIPAGSQHHHIQKPRYVRN